MEKKKTTESEVTAYLEQQLRSCIWWATGTALIVWFIFLNMPLALMTGFVTFLVTKKGVEKEAKQIYEEWDVEKDK